MKINVNKQSSFSLKDKVNSFVLNVNKISKELNGDIYNIPKILDQYVQDIPDFLEAGMNSTRYLSKIKNFAIARESLEQCKTYLEMLKSMKVVSTQDLINQIEEINKLIENQIKNKE